MTGTLLVTGGGGFVGSYAARFFASQGWKVIAFDNLSREELLGGRGGPIPPTYNWERLRREDDVSLVRGDVRQLQDIRPVVEKADAIIHAAGQVAVTTSLEDPRADFEVNLLGTLNVLEAARLSGSDPSVLFCSTNKVYGDNVNRIPVREEGSRYVFSEPAYMKGIPTDFPVDSCGHTPYGVSKLAADLYVQDYAHTYGLKTDTFRMSCIYGEGQSGNEDQGWVAHFTLSMLRDKPLTIFGDGKQVRDVLHVEDLVRAFRAALESDRTSRGGVFNIGGGSENTLSLLELLDLVRELTGKEASLSFSDWRSGDQKVYISDISRAETVLGWKPSISPREGVARLIRWYTSEFLS
ncbi:MAG: NAD-dependent epimerase/dehydratase family protein [Thermoplasmata archaeon]